MYPDSLLLVLPVIAEVCVGDRSPCRPVDPEGFAITTIVFVFSLIQYEFIYILCTIFLGAYFAGYKSIYSICRWLNERVGRVVAWLTAVLVAVCVTMFLPGIC